MTQSTENGNEQQALKAAPFAFKPYENDHQSLQIGELVFENQTDKVIAYGDIEITKNKQGLEQALKLQQLFNLIVAKLQSAEQAGDFTQDSNKQGGITGQESFSKEVDNPFS
ncbi:hypothetical protein [Psychrobacter phenylpyruvicus]|uniref:Uncharacterized protein n=1 Tax=Psychrobacter phenylpyruvicus TaxID=29432 RepID=A0A379LNT3_9GAMM|nr:hypothetical protein [Psychrobacter phenylpyruvicus]SUD92213.1 Uncharacterised protein [Psychrobacter phenylpyruvicus]